MAEPEITTERLKLSRLLLQDASAFFDYRSRPVVCRYQAFEPSVVEDATKFIRTLEANTFGSPGTWYQFGVRLRELGTLIGDLGIHFPADKPRQAEIGFTIAPDYQGQRYATEAICAILDYLFYSFELHRVYASVDPRNERSMTLLERIGMRQEAHFRKSLLLKDQWVDDVIYGILESEWCVFSPIGPSQ